MSCPDTTTDLSDEEAHLILEPYFEAVRERYIDAGLDRCPGERPLGDRLLLAPEAAELSENTVLAIVAHELGHATDFLYPGQFAMRGDDEPAAWRDPESMKPKHWHRWLKDWEARDDDLVELSADAIAHFAMGVRYGYRGPCLIQTFGAARLRPVGLR